jgi:hypothetical protein
MLKWLIGGLVLIAVVAVGVRVGYGAYTVAGTRLQAEQVQKVAVTGQGRRMESTSRAAIDQALHALRWGAVLGPWNDLKERGPCVSRQVGFLTKDGWVWVQIPCPSGFFLDIL